MNKRGLLVTGMIVVLSGVLSCAGAEFIARLTGVERTLLIWVAWPALAFLLALGHGLMVAAGEADRNHPGLDNLGEVEKIECRADGLG